MPNFWSNFSLDMFIAIVITEKVEEITQVRFCNVNKAQNLGLGWKVKPSKIK